MQAYRAFKSAYVDKNFLGRGGLLSAGELEDLLEES